MDGPAHFAPSLLPPTPTSDPPLSVSLASIPTSKPAAAAAAAAPLLALNHLCAVDMAQHIDPEGPDVPLHTEQRGCRVGEHDDRIDAQSLYDQRRAQRYNEAVAPGVLICGLQVVQLQYDTKGGNEEDRGGKRRVETWSVRGASR